MIKELNFVFRCKNYLENSTSKKTILSMEYTFIIQRWIVNLKPRLHKPIGPLRAGCDRSPIVCVLRCHCTWPACAPLVSRASMRVSCVDIWNYIYTQVSPVPFVCHTGRGKDPFGTLICMTNSEWVCYQSLTAHQHQKGHTMPNQSATKQPTRRSGCDQFWVDDDADPCDLM